MPFAKTRVRFQKEKESVTRSPLYHFRYLMSAETAAQAPKFVTRELVK